MGNLCCLKYNNYISKTEPLITKLNIESIKKDIIMTRFLKQISKYESKSVSACLWYRIMQVITITGGVLLPSFLSIQHTTQTGVDPAILSMYVYWISFGLSVTVALCNTFIAAFKLDGNYYKFNLTKEKLKSEGWKYMSLIGRYEGGTHDSMFYSFIHEIESVIKHTTIYEYTDNSSSNKKINIIPSEKGDKTGSEKDFSMLNSLSTPKLLIPAGFDEEKIDDTEISIEAGLELA